MRLIQMHHEIFFFIIDGNLDSKMNCAIYLRLWMKSRVEYVSFLFIDSLVIKAKIFYLWFIAIYIVMS